MKEEYSNIFSLVWALMPLSPSELQQIPKGHRIRPYLIFEINGEYYGFSCTSNVFNKKNRYANSQVVLNYHEYYKKTLVKIEKVYKIPLNNFKGFFKSVYKYDENEIVKKIQANFQFSDYPPEVIDYFELLPIKISCGDMVMQNNRLYSVVGIMNKKLVLVPIYKYPFNNSVECSTDGLMYYADVDNMIFLQNDNSFKYCTEMYGLYYGKDNKDKNDIKELVEYYSSLPRVKCDCCYDKICMLEPGMIIDYISNDKTYKMIVLAKNEMELDVILGNEKEFYSNFNQIKLPIDTNMIFEVTGVLNNERLNKLCDKFLLNKKENILSLKRRYSKETS